MSDIDLRSFKYPLEPLLIRENCRLEVLQTKISSVQREIEQSRKQYEEIKSLFDAFTLETVSSLSDRIDTLNHQRNLSYLIDLRNRIQEKERNMAMLVEDKAGLFQMFLDIRRHIELLKQLKGGALQEFSTSQQRVHSAEMDKAWIARIAWKDIVNPGIRQHEGNE